MCEPTQIIINAMPMEESSLLPLNKQMLDYIGFNDVRFSHAYHNS